MAANTDARKAVYAGSFDLLTIGHLWMIEAGARLFDRLLVSVGKNPKKQGMFPVEDRVEMLEEVTAGMDNVEVGSFGEQYLFEYAREVETLFLLRGIRDQDDYSFERMMRSFNNDHAPELLSVALLPPRDLEHVSSSFVKELIGFNGWEDVIPKYAPEPVVKRILEMHRD